MTGWHEGRMVAFDLETTGPDPKQARIVTACVAVIDGSGQEAPSFRAWLVDPGTEIPDEAAAIHGITTEKARADGEPAAQAVPDIALALFRSAGPNAPVVAYNASYDLTVLDRELRRQNAGAQPPGTVPVIDPYVLDKHLDRYRKGSRKLTAACAHYGVRLDGAHDASFDAVAAARVAWRIARNFPAIAAMSLAELHELQVKAKAEQAGSFEDYLRRQGKAERIDRCWPLCTCPDGAE